MNPVQDHKKYQLLLILLISFFLVPTFPGLAKAETDTASTGVANAATVSTQTVSPAPAASEATSSVKASTEATSVASDGSNSGKATSGLSQSGVEQPSSPPAEKPQANPTPASEKPDVAEASTEKAQAGDASQAEKDAKEKATAGATDKEKTPSDDASQAEKEANEENTTGITDKEKASAGDPAQAEEKKPEAINPAQVDTGITENEDPSQLKNETAEALPSTKEAEVLEKGETLEVESLAKAPMALGAGAGNPQKTIEVKSFEELKKAIEDAGNTPTTIKITKSFTLTEALTIGKDQDITLTATNERKEEAWKPIDQPAKHAGEGETKQREIIEEGRKRGEEALKKADLKENPLPSEDKNDIIIKRAEDFVKDTLFRVYGKLTLGTEDSAVYIDGNGDKARTAFDGKGSVIDVNGELVMKNAVIMNSYNKHGYTGPIRVNSGGKFTMEGGRISSNTSYEQLSPESERPYAAGAVYVRPGGTFTMTNGLIDNNVGGLTGGVFAGDLSGSSGTRAIIEIEGGIIAKNRSITKYQMGGGINGFPASKITITDGIIAGNISEDVGGGIGISSQYIGDPSNILNDEKVTVRKDYQEWIKKNKAEAKIDGGLIYKNQSNASGGGIYVDSNDVHFGKTMFLDNRAGQFGGGIYISFAPITQKLEHILITENLAKGHTDAKLGGSNGGGIWNCPLGFVHIGDGHSVYVYNNNADSYGKDITFVKKAWNFTLNGKYVGSEFYSHLSPVTEGKHIIQFIEDGRGRDYGETIPGSLSYHTTFSYLKALYSQALIEEAWKNSETFVLGNRARNGGGLGSNANLTTPEDKGDYQMEFRKKWDSSVDRYHAPTTVRVDLFIVPTDKDAAYVKANYGMDHALYKYGEILIREADGWQTRFHTNKYNGADKERILKLLGIKSFADIGLPENAFKMDNGLPFTADELAQMGYKYLVVEQGTGYHVEITEEKPTAGKTEKGGILEITRKYNDDYDDESVRKDKDLYFYLYDPEKQVLTRIGQTKIHEDADTPGTGTTTFVHPLLLKKVSEFKYYGKDRKFTEYLKYGWDGMVGYHNLDSGYAIVLTKNADGTLTVEVPYLWTDDYYQDGFSAHQPDGTEDYVVKSNDTHIVTLTNSNWGKLDIEKSWQNIAQKDIPDSIDLYLLLDGKRVIESYDEDGKPVYKKLTLKAADGWKGSFQKLDPKALAAGKYTLEEDSDRFAPEFINKKEKFIIRIGYASKYHEEGQPDNYETFTTGHFDSDLYKNKDGTYRDVKLNLYLDGKMIQQGVFHFTVRKHPITDAPYAELEKTYGFQPAELETYGQTIPVKYYDVITNEPGRDAYDFYLRKDENGAYALYLPRLVIKGVPYADLFIAENLEYNDLYQRYDPTTIVTPLKAEEDWQLKVKNHYGPTHEIEILKKWIAGQNQIPKEITVILTDADGNTQEIKITKEEDWKKVLENLKGTLRNKGYSFKEVEIPGYTSVIKTEKAGLKITGKDKNGKEITLDYMTDELKKVLESGNYRYEVFTLGDKDKGTEFNRENLNTFIRIEKQADDRYIIYYAKVVTLAEMLNVQVKNTENPPERPPVPGTRIIRVTKVWNLAGHENPVSEIIVELYRDGQATGRQLTLNASNNWTGSFTGLEIADKANPAQKYQYTIKEVGDVNGLFEADGKKFEVSYTGDMSTGFTITNKEIPEKPPQPPETPEEPPVTPPETPEKPPVTPPVTPEEPPVVPQTPPTVPEAPGKAPQTGLPANGAPFLLMAMGLVGLRLTRRRKRTDGQ